MRMDSMGMDSMNCEDRNLGPDAPALAGDELAWRAFRYLHGELKEAEVEAFEEDLATEHSAREALAQAVRLTAALEVAEVGGAEVGAVEIACNTSKCGTRELIATRLPQRTASAFVTLWQSRLSQPRVLVGTGIAACLAVAVTLILMGRFGPRGAGHSGPTDPGNAEAALAKAWVVIGRDEEWQHVTSTLPAISSSDGDSADGGPDASVGPDVHLHPDHEGGPEAGLSVPIFPSWMLAALDPQPSETPEVMQ